MLRMLIKQDKHHNYRITPKTILPFNIEKDKKQPYIVKAKK